MLSPEQRLLTLEQQFPELRSILSHFDPPTLIAMLDSAGSPEAFRRELDDILLKAVDENVEKFIKHINEKAAQQTEDAVKAIQDHTQKALTAIAQKGAEALAALMAVQALDSTTGTAAVSEKREDTRSPALKQYEEAMQNFVGKFNKPEGERTAAEKDEMKAILTHVDTQMHDNASNLMTQLKEAGVNSLKEFKAIKEKTLEVVRNAAAETTLPQGPQAPALQSEAEKSNAQEIRRAAVTAISKNHEIQTIAYKAAEHAAALIAMQTVRAQRAKLIQQAVSAAKEKGIDLPAEVFKGKKPSAITAVIAKIENGKITAENVHEKLPGAAPTAAAAAPEAKQHEKIKAPPPPQIDAPRPETPSAAADKPASTGIAPAGAVGRSLHRITEEKKAAYNSGVTPHST